MSSQKLEIFNNLSKPFVKLVEKYYPDAFIFVIVLSVLTFVLALVNTDSTSIEVLEAWGNGLPKLFTFTAQITIILTAVLASIGTAAVPSAGIVMLIIILQAIGVDGQGIALIVGVDRILDMIRTATNVTGDATVASVMDSLER